MCVWVGVDWCALCNRFIPNALMQWHKKVSINKYKLAEIFSANQAGTPNRRYKSTTNPFKVYQHTRLFEYWWRQSTMNSSANIPDSIFLCVLRMTVEWRWQLVSSIRDYSHEIESWNEAVCVLRDNRRSHRKLHRRENVRQKSCAYQSILMCVFGRTIENSSIHWTWASAKRATTKNRAKAIRNIDDPRLGCARCLMNILIDEIQRWKSVADNNVEWDQHSNNNKNKSNNKNSTRPIHKLTSQTVYPTRCRVYLHNEFFLFCNWVLFYHRLPHTLLVRQSVCVLTANAFHTIYVCASNSQT